MNERNPIPVIEAMDLTVLAHFVRKHLALNVPDEWIDEILDQAQKSNGPAEFIVGTWWEALSYDSQARYWFASSASHNHAPAFAKLRSMPQPERTDDTSNSRIAG